MKYSDDNELLLPFEDVSSSRRGFLRLVGFGLANAGLAGCSRGPTVDGIPALVAPTEFVPGRNYWIASTCGGCEAGCGVLAKCRDGRPLKLEGTSGHPISGGGLCPAGQGSILSLYDSLRFDGPQRVENGSYRPLDWSTCDQELAAVLDRAREESGRIRLLTGTVHSPSTRAVIARFLAEFPGAVHVSYDGLSASAILDAHELTHGARCLPHLDFARARTIVSFDADFLSTWISPVEFTAGYTAGRRLVGDSPRMSRHYQLEARTSLTGCRADVRRRLAPHRTSAVLGALCDLLEQRAGSEPRLAGCAEALPELALVERMVDDLWSARGESLVISGSNELELQVLANYANHLLGNYGSTLDLVRPSLQRLGSDRAVEQLRAELEAGTVDVLIVQGVNPAYDLAGRLPIERARAIVSCASAPDETTALAGWVCPEPNFLEAWSDGEPRRGAFVLSQPTVPVLRAGRSLRATLSAWLGEARSDRELIRETWRTTIHARHTASEGFDAFFDQALHDGSFVATPDRRRAPEFRTDAVQPPPRVEGPKGDELELVLYAKAGMLDGRHAHNPWLHELPDPVSKLTWDNYACLSPDSAKGMNLVEGDKVRVTLAAGGRGIELPVHVQRGQADGTVAVALGYGRSGTDRFSRVGPEWLEGRATLEPGGGIGGSAAALVGHGERTRRFSGSAVTVVPTGGRVALASTQDYHSLSLPEHLATEGHEVREMVFSSSFEEWRADRGSVVHRHSLPKQDLWQEDHESETGWGMVIDLARCTGCSACVVGCQAENNVPVVGRDEVLRHREMSWLRIDRYFQGEGDELRTLHQPMLCQHCGHAPCESVCPVLATVHSAEGLNQQVYNRCVGTRYCANTCPYKVRRFNWFDYPHEDELANHALNPDVTVRSRGVMEKCSFCIQRIQEAKAEARRQGRDVRDGDIAPACQQSCPADAIVFGNAKDPASRVARSSADPRAYAVLEELNVRPSIRYLAHIHNGTTPEGSHGH